MSICQRISRVIALTSVSWGVWIWRWVEGSLYMHTHFQHTHGAIRLICVTLNNLKLHLHSSCFLAHIPSPLWLHDYETGLWLLYFSYYRVHADNHDHLSPLQETAADYFIGFFCSLAYIFTFICCWDIFFFFLHSYCGPFVQKSVNNHFFITLGRSYNPKANLAKNL